MVDRLAEGSLAGIPQPFSQTSSITTSPHGELSSGEAANCAAGAAGGWHLVERERMSPNDCKLFGGSPRLQSPAPMGHNAFCVGGDQEKLGQNPAARGCGRVRISDLELPGLYTGFWASKVAVLPGPAHPGNGASFLGHGLLGQASEWSWLARRVPRRAARNYFDLKGGRAAAATGG